MYKALLTDLGNVVIFFDRRRVAAGLQKFTATKTVDEVDTLINKSTVGVTLLEQFETGAIDADLYHDGINELLGTRVPANEFWRRHGDLFMPNMPVINLWVSLRAARLVKKILAVTDTDPVRLQAGLTLLESCGLTLDDAVASYEVGHRKPHHAMYDTALARAGVSANECIFVDDNPEYVDAAKDRGINGIWYPAHDPHAQDMLVSSMRTAGLLI